MEIKVFSVYDSKAEAYLAPFFMNTRGQALRAWDDVVNDQKTDFYKHPADYTLFEIGSYDDKTGILEAYADKTPLGKAIEFRKDKEYPCAV